MQMEGGGEGGEEGGNTLALAGPKAATCTALYEAVHVWLAACGARARKHTFVNAFLRERMLPAP